MSLDQKLLDDLPDAIEALRLVQGFHPLTEYQIKMFEFMVTKHNSASQLPTGSGKTYPVICLPLVLDLLRDSFGHKVVPETTRVLYIVPLGKP